MKKQASDQSFHDRRYQERKRAEAAKKAAAEESCQGIGRRGSSGEKRLGMAGAQEPSSCARMDSRGRLSPHGTFWASLINLSTLHLFFWGLTCGFLFCRFCLN